jgi:predicted transcriptional regulator
MYLKWNLTTKLRKKTEAKELHNLVLRMLEKVKVRKFIREVSLIGKSTIAIYYITDFHERIKEAFTRAKVTMVERPSEDLPQDVGVRNAAVNRVAFLLRRHYYLTKLRALLLQQLDTEELRQEAIAKSLPRYHD